MRQNYVDDQLVGSGNLSHAAIIGHDGNNWAITKGWSLKPGEGAKVVASFKDPASVFGTGITIEGNKYLGIKADARSIYGKKGTSGVVLVKTGQAILVCVYGENQLPGNATNTAEKLADYLIENGY